MTQDDLYNQEFNPDGGGPTSRDSFEHLKRVAEEGMVGPCEEYHCVLLNPGQLGPQSFDDGWIGRCRDNSQGRGCK